MRERSFSFSVHLSVKNTETLLLLGEGVHEMAVLRSSTILSLDVPLSADVLAPVARAVDAHLRRAIAARASDLHIEPSSDGAGRTRLRVDGVMRAGEPIARELFAPLISRLKLLAGLDIANHRLPQDGRYSFAVDARRIDARVSSLPTLDGEKLVVRFFDHHVALPQLDDLGMDSAALAVYRTFAHAPWGFVVVSGPTGSGKTTTLYASIAELNRGERNVCTVEDPVEARLRDVSQLQVNVRAGLTFPAALRSFVRQDPDVIMIGEMRDAETAAVGVSAALAGQTVFATVHSNDAPRTVDRLVELGVARHSLAAALSAVVAQRLVRKLCPACRRAETVPIGVRAAFSSPNDRWFVPSACAACDGTGYAGRTGVFEVLAVDDRIREAIAAGRSSTALARVAAEGGHRSLFDHAATKVAAGETSFAEIERVVGWWAR
jgi:type II secretory ATPase GspE/PulE/Tfp pilus assembly ATPase PilB-like protein